jgi:hypothetical protein
MISQERLLWQNEQFEECTYTTVCNINTPELFDNSFLNSNKANESMDEQYIFQK